ncbi:hypothetical protein B0H10DRAFT_1941201 [Mycena sp. CBHHK59/15]|nr:hypothetical protein B0H10DRAFT_1941201 [Mycena sp. CBHHK59/15]
MAQNNSPLDIVAPEAFYSTSKPARPTKSAQPAKKKTPAQQRSLASKTKANFFEKADATLETIHKDFDGLGMANVEILWHNINPEGYSELASVAPLTFHILALMAEQEQDEMPELEPAGMLIGEIEGGNGQSSPDMKSKL